MTTTADLEVLHGYTMADLDRLTRGVVTAHLGWWAAGNRQDQYDTAWSGIAEHLCAATDAPKPSDLTAAGTRALDRDVKDSQRHHGSDRAGGTRPRYAAFWYEPPTEPWEERLIDRLAAEQILAAVPDGGRQAIAVFAVAPTRDAAAVALGVSVRTLDSRLSRARKICRTHWYAPDAAPAMKPASAAPGRMPSRSHCDAGHELTPDNLAWTISRGPGKPRYGRCRKCEQKRSQERTAARRAAAGAAA